MAELSEDQKLLERISSEEPGAVEELYNQYKRSFLIWAMVRHSVTKPEAEDVFQDAVVQTYSDIRSGKLSEVETSLKAYVYRTGELHLRNWKRKTGRVDYISDSRDTFKQIAWEKHGEDNPQLERLNAALNSLGDTCQKLLRLFYFKQYDMQSVARELGFASSDSAKSKKAKCMKALTALFNEGKPL